MMLNAFQLGFLLSLSVLTGCTALRQSQSTAHTNNRLYHLGIGGLKRTYAVHAPPPGSKHRSWPVVFVFHGGGDDAAGMERMTHFDALADREGFLLVYPDAFDHQWNDGREAASLKSQWEHVDDVAFVDAILCDLKAKYPIDPRRVYATGFSNGGLFAHYLAGHLARRFAAIAPVSGGIAEPFAPQFHPTAPVSVFMIHGSRDPLVPYGGGWVDHWNNGSVISTPQAAKLWATADGCRKKPVSGTLPDLDPEDGCRVRWTRWSGGKAGAEVLLYTVDGGGHTWPNGPQYLPQWLIGRVCRDFDAEARIWEFFQQHQK